MPRTHKPRAGSRQFIPHKRAKSESCKVRSWPAGEGLLGFAGYKAGMVHFLYRDTDPNSASQGRSISAPATVIEVPPLKVVAVNLYKKKTHGYDSAGMIEEKKKLEKAEADKLTLLVETQPALAGLPKKKSERFEIPVGGDFSAQLEFAKEKLGEEITVADVFENGDYVDVTAVTKGKGFQGPVKKFGIKILREKTEKSYRHAGHIGGGLTPTKTPWYAPMGGKIGYNQRTELNKQIVAVNQGIEKKEFPHYGLLGEHYILLAGSVPGPRKRLIRMRPAIRPSEKKKLEEIEVVR